MTDTSDKLVEDFKAQINETTERKLEPYLIQTADDFVNVLVAWKRAILVDMHLTEFLRLHPQLQGACNVPAIRRAILADLISKGIL